MPILVIRHGSTKLNSENRIRAWLNVPLDEHGKEEAKATGKKLKKYDLDGLVASDLDRTQETAHIISEETGVPILYITKAFRPWNVGNYSGEKHEKILPILEDYSRSKPNKKISGGESFNEFKERFITGFKELERKYPDERIGIVTHSRGDRILAAWDKAGRKGLEVDLDEFNQKGIDPGQFREVSGSKKKDMAQRMR